MEIISRKEAKEQGLTRYFTGVPCPKGHIAEKTISNGNCAECLKEYKRNWAKNNPEETKLRKKKTYQKNIETIKKYSRYYYQKNAEEKREYTRQWKKANPEKRNAMEAKRKASKMQRTPIWANQSEITMWYEVAEVLSRSGIKFHVDHVVPLQGKTVSGLHVENNMQILPAYINISKHNQWNWEIQKHGYA
jgi:hypothetical protein